MRDSRSEHEQPRQDLNARLLRFRAQPEAEDALALAEDLLSEGRFVDARGVARGAQPHPQEDAGLLVLEGRAFLAERDLVRAQAVLQRAVRAAPTLQTAYRYLGEVLLKRGDPQRAAKTLQRALQLAPDDHEAATLAARAEYLAEAADGDPEVLPSLDEAISHSRPSARAQATQPPVLSRRASATPAAQNTSSTSTVPPPRREPLPKPYMAKPGDQTRPTRRRRRDDESTAEYQRSVEAEQRAVPPVPPLPPLQPPAAPELPLVSPARAAAAVTTAGPPPRPPPPMAANVSAPPPLPRRAVEPSVVIAEDISEPDLPLTAAEVPALGSEHAAPVDAERVLGIVRSLGLFEAPDTSTAAWLGAQDVPRQGQRLRNTLIGLWVVTVVLCAGGYLGFRVYVGRRHAEAERLLAEAGALTERADHAAFVDAERLLRLAREQHPSSPAIPAAALLLQIQRVLDDGERDTAALRTALARAARAGVTGAALPLARALLAAASGNASERDQALDETLHSAAGDGHVLYALGRIEQRLGRARALDHLQAAARALPKGVSAPLALAELAYDADDRTSAQRYTAAALAIAPTQLRARLLALWSAVDDREPSALLHDVTQLAPSLQHGARDDRALAALIRAHAARRAGDRVTAASAVSAAGDAGADTATLLTWIAREALAVGNLTLAQALASQALIQAPELTSTRRLLARVLIERRDGEHALLLLEKLPPEDAQAQILKAQAALSLADPEALTRALAGLAELAASKRELATRVQALRIRIEAKQAPGPANVTHARTLLRSVPGDPDALLALAEAGLAARDANSAQGALKQLLIVTPDDANAYCLQGRAWRMAGDAAAAEQSFRHALTLSSHETDALDGLAGLLLDQGRYADADRLYQELTLSTSNGLSGRLGRVEALTGLHRFDAARVQLDAVPEAQRETAGYREVAAKLALATGAFGPALSELRALVSAQPNSASVLALYGDALSAAQQDEAAAAAYKGALERDAALPEALLGSAAQQLLVKKPKLKVVFAGLERAADALHTRIRPPTIEAHRLVLLARALLLRAKRGDLDAARTALLAAVKVPGVEHDAYFFLGEASGGKSHAEARTAYQRYLELEPHGRYRERALRAR